MDSYQKSARILLAIGLTILFSLAFLAPTPKALAGPAEDAYTSAEAAFREFKGLPDDKKKFAHRWQAVIDKFKAVAEKYPNSSEADKALFTEGKLYYDKYEISRVKSDLSSAIDAWKSCATNYPKSTLADDSLLGEAKAWQLLGRPEQALAAVNAILDQYPKGDKVREAKQLQAKLQAEGVSAATPTLTAVVEATATPRATPTPTAVVVAPTPTATPVPVAVVAPAVTSGGTAGSSQQVRKLLVIPAPGYTRVVVYADGEVHWHAGTLKAEADRPARIYVDLDKARLGEELKKAANKVGSMWEIPIGDGLLKQARVGQHDADTVRVVMDLAAIKSWTVIPGDDPFRLIFDFNGSSGFAEVAAATPEAAGSATPVEVAAGSPTPMGTAVAVATPMPSGTASPEAMAGLKKANNTGIPYTEQLGLKATKIFIDAGHGGFDPGAIGPGGTREKDINLAVALILKKKLGERGYEGVLTRKDDTFLELDERSGLANAGGGDLLVSVHCNSVDKKGDHNASGIETYYADVASDRASARLSATENQTTVKKMSELDTILQTLTRNEYTQLSYQFATTVENVLVEEAKAANPELKVHNNGVKSALFYVCLTAHMPAILVEMGFISNPREEKKLVDPKYQEVLAEGIAAGADNYLDSTSRKARPVMVPAPSPIPTGNKAEGGGSGTDSKTAKKRH